MTISIWAIRIADGSIDIMSGPGSISRELSYDTSRIAAAVVTGMGFLGAGAIIKDKFTVRGLSTAATLWISAALGLACGSGFIIESVAFTILVLLIIAAINVVNKSIKSRSPSIAVKAMNDYPLIKNNKRGCYRKRHNGVRNRYHGNRRNGNNNQNYPAVQNQSKKGTILLQSIKKYGYDTA